MKGQLIRSVERLGRAMTTLFRVATLSTALIAVLQLPAMSALAEDLAPADPEPVEIEQAEAEVEEVECFLGDWGEAAESDEDGTVWFEGLEIEPEAEGEAPEEEAEFDLMAPEADEGFADEALELPAEDGDAAEADAPWAVEKTVRVDGADCCVTVRYDSEAGIPQDAVLTARALDENGKRARNAKRAAGDSENCEMVLMSLSLIGDGVDYANTYRYEVEVVMDSPVTARPDEVRAMRFEGSEPTMLDATAKVGTGVERVSFRAGNV